MRAIALSLALCLAVPELAQAITFENPTRTASASLTLCGPPPSPCNVIGADLESADLGEMDVTATIPIAGNASAYQTSLLVGSHAEGSGGIQLVQSLAEAAHSQATSSAAFEFALDGPALVRISFAFNYSQNPLAPVAVLWAGGGLFELLPEGEQATVFGGGVDASSGPASDSRSLQFEQVLPVGRYGFSIASYGFMFWHPDSLSTSDWAFTLDVTPVPEPAGLAPTAALALALTRRFGGAGPRSRHA